MPILRTLALLAALVGLATPVAAQGLFDTVATVDNRAITGFELDQRARMLDVFRSPGDLRAEALESLIDERVQLAEAERLDIEATEEQIAAGMEEFAGRANLTTEQFLAELAQAGVEPESFRDFIRAGVLWRQIVRARFGETIRIEPIEIDRAADEPAPAPGLQFQVNEIILPANTPRARAQVEALTPQLTAITSFSAFEQAARTYSASVSRQAGGRIPPLDAATLPGPIRDTLRALRPGEVAGPVPIPNGAVFFQLRSINELPAPADTRAIDFALVALPDGGSAETRSRAAAIEARADTCDDLYAEVPGAAITRDTLAPTRIPPGIAMVLARLDAGEIATAALSDQAGNLTLVMLCGRGVRPEEEVDRDAVQERLYNRRLAGKARNYLADLRANAAIVRR